MSFESLFSRSPQESPIVLENNADAIFNVLVNDYLLGQEWNFIVKVVFPHCNPRFTHLKTVVHPQESFVFVVGQMEVIEDDFYIYARDINLIDINRLKRKIFDNSFNRSSEGVNVTRSKLLSVYQNINENSKNIHKAEDSSSVLNDSIDEFHSGSFSTDDISSKRARVESCDESVDEFDNSDKCDVESDKFDCSGEVVGDNMFGKSSKKGNFQSSKKGKEPISGSLRHALRSNKSSVNSVGDE